MNDMNLNKLKRCPTLLTLRFKQTTCLLFTAFCAFCMTSCNNEDEFDPNEIRLGGQLTTMNVDTRGTGPITGVKPSQALSLNIYRADATSGTTYGGTYTSNFTGTMAATSGTITMNPLQYYLADVTRSTKLIALYPSGGTYSSANKTVTYAALDGGTDIMCSAPVQGSRNTPMSAMTFSHMLTQVHVQVKAQNAAAVAAWGNVTGITIAGKKTSVVVTLPNPTSGAASIAATGAATALPLTTPNGGPASTSQTLTTTAATYGYGMFLPVTTAGTLTFNITTAKGGTQTLTTATAQKFEAGKAYVMEITFNVEAISVTATLTDWAPGNTITGKL